MKKKESDLPAAENPEEFTGLELTSPSTVAAGLPAVAVALKHVIGEAGLVRGMKALSGLNQKDGFTCPSCAWPDPDDERSGLAEYCENGAKAVAEEATSKKIGAAFFARHSVSYLSGLSDHELGRSGRLAEPLYLRKGSDHYEAISWDLAFQKTAEALRSLSSPDEAIFYTSGRTSNEAAFLYQLFVRDFGTNNLPDCSNMCHESSGVALTESLGIGKGSVTLNDFYDAEVIMILGQNPGTNHPRMMTALEKAKEKGAYIISVNPLPEAGLISFKNPQRLKGMIGKASPLTDVFLQVTLNGDMALLQLLSRMLLEAEDRQPGTVVDRAFINQKTTGFEDWKEHLNQLDEAGLLEQCGVPLEEIRKAADLLARNKRIIVCWAMGLTQHVKAVDTIKEIVNLLLLKGSIGIPGGGTCPVRGHSNVQGDRTVGINEKPPASFLDSLEKHFGIPMPRHHGYDVVESIKAMHEGRARVFFAMGGNFLSATPDTAFTAEALRKCRLTVHVSTKLNRSHLVHGDEALILPCLSRSDRDEREGILRFVTCENSMGVVQMSKGMLKPVSDRLLSEPEIVCRLAMAVNGPSGKIGWEKYKEDYDRIREAIEKTIPGFENYNERVRNPGGFYLPNGNREQVFHTPDGKARFNKGFPEGIPLKDGQWVMMTIRSHDQFNTTVYGLDDRYRGIRNERRVILLNKEDLEEYGFQDGEVVNIINEDDGIRREARRFIIVSYPISRRCAATYFPEANVLVPLSKVAEKSNTPVSKAVVIRLERPAEEVSKGD